MKQSSNLDEVFEIAEDYMEKKDPMSIGYHGNIVGLLEYIVKNNKNIDLLSDQTSCHAAYEGGYCR